MNAESAAGREAERVKEIWRVLDTWSVLLEQDGEKKFKLGVSVGFQGELRAKKPAPVPAQNSRGWLIGRLHRAGDIDSRTGWARVKRSRQRDSLPKVWWHKGA